jgi:hypothetical protein
VGKIMEYLLLIGLIADFVGIVLIAISFGGAVEAAQQTDSHGLPPPGIERGWRYLVSNGSIADEAAASSTSRHGSLNRVDCPERD